MGARDGDLEERIPFYSTSFSFFLCYKRLGTFSCREIYLDLDLCFGMGFGGGRGFDGR